MDIIIGITLAIVALLALLVAFVWLTDHHSNVRKSGPAARAFFALLWTALALVFAVDLGHSAGERFGWWDEPRSYTCTTTTYYNPELDKVTSEANSCTEKHRR